MAKYVHFPKWYWEEAPSASEVVTPKPTLYGKEFKVMLGGEDVTHLISDFSLEADMYGSGGVTLTLPVTPLKPTVSDPQSQRIRALAQKMLDKQKEEEI